MRKESKFVGIESPFEALDPVEAPKSNFLDRIQKQVLYLWDDTSETLIKSIPKENKFMAKIPPDGEEFEIGATTDPVVRAIGSEFEVTKKIYDNNVNPTTDKAVAG